MGYIQGSDITMGMRGNIGYIPLWTRKDHVVIAATCHCDCVIVADIFLPLKYIQGNQHDTTIHAWLVINYTSKQTRAN